MALPNHVITQDSESGRYRCAVCGGEWKSAPYSQCPGVPVYAWGAWPEHLLTKKQMNEAGFQIGQKLPAPAGAVYRSKSPGGIMWLYDRNQGVPKRQMSEAQQAALEKAKHMAEKVFVDCRVCGSGVAYVTRATAEEWGPTLCDRCADRDEAREWARARVATGCLILDTETTGLNDAEVVQIAVIDHQGHTLLDTLVMPRRPYRMFERSGRGLCAHDIHGIALHDVCQAPSWGVVARHLARLVEGRRVLVYNVGYDLSIINAMNRDFGVPEHNWDDWECLMEWYAQYCGDWSEYFKSYRWQKLPGGDHSALGDCRASLDVLRAMVGSEER